MVLHFACPASPIDYLQLPIETLKVGSIGTLHALGLASEKGARFVLASTSEVYGDPEVHPQPETYWGNVNPVGPRGRLRRGQAVRRGDHHRLPQRPRRRHRHRAHLQHLRPADAARRRPRHPQLHPAGAARRARSRSPVTAPRPGRSATSTTWCAGILALVGSDQPGPVNLGNPHELSMLELARWVIELAGSGSTIVHVERPVDDPKVRRPDTTLAETALGWAPRGPRSRTGCCAPSSGSAGTPSSSASPGRRRNR